MKQIFYIVIIIALSTELLGQSMSVLDPSPSDFPLIKANFYAFDAQGNQIKNFTPDDIYLNENGIQRTVVNVSCPDSGQSRILSSVLALDVSYRMVATKFDLAKYAAETWIRSLPLGDHKCAVVSFAEDNVLNQDFTNSINLLLKSVENIPQRKGKSFDAAFIDEISGSLLVVDSAENKRIVVLISDGIGSGEYEKIIEKALQVEASVYCLVISEPASTLIREVCDRTGGRYFENINSPEEVDEAIRTAIYDAMEVQPCTIEWEAPGCELSRKAFFEISKYGLTANCTYTVPDSNFSIIEFLPGNSISFKDVPPGGSDEKQITILVKNKAATITSISNINPLFKIKDYGGPPPPFTLDPDMSRVLTIEFSPIDSSFAYDKYQLESDACIGKYFFATGGFKVLGPGSNTLELVFPNGGEDLIAGSDTSIFWEGVLPSDEIVIEYSTDNGMSWNGIDIDAKGQEYSWSVPSTPSNECLMSVKRYADGIMDASIVLEGHEERVNCVSWNPGGLEIASGSYENLIVWDKEQEEINFTKKADDTWINSVDYNPDGTFIAYGTSNGDIIILRSTGELIGSIPAHTDGILSIAWSPDGQRIASGGADGNLKMWQASPPMLLKNFNENVNWIQSVCWSPDGRFIAAGNGYNTISVWDVENQSLVHELTGHSASIYSVDWSPDGKFIASGSGDSDVKIWDAATGDNIHTFSGHFWKVYSVAWSADGTLLASCSEDNKIFIWDWANKNVFNVLHGHTGPVRTIDWSKDGFWLASGSFDKTVRLWKADARPEQIDYSDSLWSIITPTVAGINSINMGQVIVDDYKDSLVSAYLENTGSLPIRIDGIEIRGGNADEFNVYSSEFPVFIPPGEKKDVYFRFSPSSVGIKFSTVYAYTQSDTVKTSIVGEGVESVLELKYDIVDFGGIPIGATRDTLITLLWYTGSDDLTITRTDIIGPNTDDFEIIEGGAPFILNSNNRTRQFRLSFKPSFMGLTNTVLAINTEDDNDQYLVFLYGFGLPANPVLSAAPLNFESVLCRTDKEMKLAVHNIGSRDLKIDDYEITGQFADDFKLKNPFSPIVIPPAEHDSLELIYTPAEIGNSSATLTLFSNSINSNEYHVPLYGRKDTTALYMENTIIDFGKVCPGIVKDSSITITSLSSIRTTFNADFPETEFTVSGADPFESEFIPGESRFLGIEFTAPALEGIYTYTISITDTCGNLHELFLKAEVIDAGFSGISDIDFDTLDIGSESYEQISIANISNGAISVGNPYIKNGSKEFSFTTIPVLPGIIPSGNNLVFDIVFSPDRIGVFKDTIVVEILEPCKLSYEFEISGYCRAVSIVRIPELEGAIGHPDFRIPVYAKLNYPDTLPGLSYRAKISFNTDLYMNESLLSGQIISSSYIDNKKIVEIEGDNIDLYPSEILLNEFSGTVMLGGNKSSDLRIEEFKWLTGDLDLDLLSIELDHGRLRTSDICAKDVRAVIVRFTTIMELMPNPASENVEIIVESEEQGSFNLSIYSIDGSKMKNINWNKNNSGRSKKTVNINLDTFVNGVYQVVLTTPGRTINEELVVVK